MAAASPNRSPSSFLRRAPSGYAIGRGAFALTRRMAPVRVGDGDFSARGVYGVTAVSRADNLECRARSADFQTCA